MESCIFSSTGRWPSRASGRWNRVCLCRPRYRAKIGNAVFSGTQNIFIAEGTGTLIVKADFHTTGKGTAKKPIVGMPVYLYDKSRGSCAAGIGISPKNYPEIYAECSAVAEIKTDGWGEAIFSPATGNYVVIGLYEENGTIIGRSVGQIDVGDEVYKYLQVLNK